MILFMCSRASAKELKVVLPKCFSFGNTCVWFTYLKLLPFCLPNSLSVSLSLSLHLYMYNNLTSIFFCILTTDWMKQYYLPSFQFQMLMQHMKNMCVCVWKCWQKHKNHKQYIENNLTLKALPERKKKKIIFLTPQHSIYDMS